MEKTAQTTHKRPMARQRGFTLIEVLIATLLIGIAITALLAANGSSSRINGVGMEMSTAEFLIEQVRELTATLAVVDPQTSTATFGAEEGSLAAYDDLDDFDGQTFSPPIDAGCNTLAALGQYSQVVTVDNVSANNFQTEVSHHASSFVRVTVRVLLNDRQISSAAWIRARY